MRVFLQKLSLFVVMQLVILAIVVVYGQPSDDHYLCSIFDKVERLKEPSAKPRVIVVGGSNVAFGVDTKSIGKKLNRKAINFGLHGALGVDFYLQQVAPHARKGDLIVVSPEFRLVMNDGLYGQHDTIRSMVELWPASRRFFKEESNLKNLLDNELVWESHIWFLRALDRLFPVAEESTRTPIFSRGGFNECGDLVVHLDRKPRRFGGGFFRVIHEENVHEAANLINEFARQCREKGAVVVFSYPAVHTENYAASEDSINQAHKILCEKLEIPIINDPDELILDRDLFFDSVNHLAAKGRRIRSNLIANRLREYEPGNVQQAQRTRDTGSLK